MHDTKKSKFSYSAKPDFPVGPLVAILKNGRYVTLSLKLRGVEPSLSTLNIGFLGRRFQKTYCQIHHAIVSAILEAIVQNGGHLQRNRSILETKRRRASIVTLCLGFMGRRFQRKYCRMHHAIASTILEAIKKTNVVHFQNNTSITETKRRRAFNFDSMSRVCGAYSCRKKYCVVCVSTRYRPF